jgi:hypothetical protein
MTVIMWQMEEMEGNTGAARRQDKSRVVRELGAETRSWKKRQRRPSTSKGVCFIATRKILWIFYQCGQF